MTWDDPLGQCGKGVICWRDLRLGEAADRKEETREWVISTGSRAATLGPVRGTIGMGQGRKSWQVPKSPNGPAASWGNWESLGKAVVAASTDRALIPVLCSHHGLFLVSDPLSLHYTPSS